MEKLNEYHAIFEVDHEFANTQVSLCRFSLCQFRTSGKQQLTDPDRSYYAMLIRPALITMLLIVPATQPLAGQDLMSYPSRDPHGWQNFKWGMSKEATVKLGARLFKDENGINRFGLPKLELLSGKSFWMDLKFYFTDTQLVYIEFNRLTTDTCPQKEFDTLLKQLQRQFGTEKESKNLEYPNSKLSSRVWAVGTTKTKLIRHCSKERKAVLVPVYSVSVIYERRNEVEPWNQ